MFTKDSKRLTGGSKVFRDFMREVDNSINLNPTGQSAWGEMLGSRFIVVSREKWP